jgi:hypothetical protein
MALLVLSNYNLTLEHLLREKIAPFIPVHRTGFSSAILIKIWPHLFAHNLVTDGNLSLIKLSEEGRDPQNAEHAYRHWREKATEATP